MRLVVRTVVSCALAAAMACTPTSSGPDGSTPLGHDGGATDGGADTDAGEPGDSGAVLDGGALDAGPVDSGQPFVDGGLACAGVNPPAALVPDIGTSEAYLGQSGYTGVTPGGCNAVAYAQVENSNYFLGRLLINTDPNNGCSGSNMKVVRFQMNWAQNVFVPVNTAFSPPQTISDGTTVVTAYDPDVASFNGQLWAAFECAGTGISFAAACVGPYSAATGTIDPAATLVAIQGKSYDPSSPYMYSASVPKLLNFQNHMYLYWSAVQARKSDGVWVRLASRGMELVVQGNRLVPIGVLGAVASYDPRYNVEVWSTASDGASNLAADMQGVYTDGQHVFATAGVGGTDNNCLGPDGNKPGCYRLQIARSFTPLAQGMFGSGLKLDDTLLPYNTVSYPRFFHRPDSSLNLLTQSFAAISSASPRPLTSAGSALVMVSLPIPTDSDYFKPSPVPTGNALLSVPFESLTGLSSGCTPAALHSSACMVAATRLCQYSYGFASGYGPVEALGATAEIVCLGSKSAARTLQDFSTLASRGTGCTSNTQALSLACNAAVNRTCQSLGYETGLSIDEIGATQGWLTCVNACAATRVNVTWAELTGAFSSCAEATPDLCTVAADRLCRQRGFLTGFGVQEASATGVQITCLAK